MRRAAYPMLIAFAVTLIPAPVMAADPDDPVHDELREFRDDLVQAILEDDIATQIELSHPDVVTMWQDGRTAKGHDGLQAFLEELGKGSERGFLGYEQEPTAAELAAVYDGQFGFAHGTSVSQYELYGMRFDLLNHWTATLLKDNGQWQLVGYHVSGNIADNPFLDAARRSLYIAGGGAGVVGLLVGIWIGRRSARRPADAANA